MSTQLQTQIQAASQPSFTSMRRGILQRKCACGQHTIAGGECAECRQKREGMIQRAAVSAAPVNAVPPLVHDVLSSPGQPLDAGTRMFMEPRFGHDFSQVRVHTDAKAAESAQAVNALAYTVGRDVVFGEGWYEPGTSEGRRLLAHVVQQEHSMKGIHERLALDVPGNIAERDAEKTAFSIVRGVQTVASHQHISGRLQRQQPGTAAVQRPLEEKTGGEQQLPSSGVEEFAQNLGPPGTKITQGGGAPPAPSSQFYVSFQNVVPPDVPDHSQAHPGPGGVRANRAGYTRVTIKKTATIGWDVGPMEAGGQVPLYAQSVNIFYRLDPIQIFVSSDYAVGSCPYRVTLAHEQSHVKAFLQLFYAGRESLISHLNRMVFPTQTAPVLVQPSNIEAQQDRIGNSLQQAVQTHSAVLVAIMEKDRDAKDAPSTYAVEYAKCPANEW